MSDQMVFVHGVDFQRAVLKLMMNDQMFCSRATSFLKEDYFTGELKWFYRTIKDFYQTYKTTPNDLSLEIEVKKHTKDAEIYETERQNIVKADTSRAEFIRRELTQFIRANIFISSYKEVATLYNAGEKEAAYQSASGRMSEVLEVDFNKEQVVKFGDHIHVLEEAALQRSEAVPTGILAIDEAMGGGMHQQSFTTFIGGSNVGKSMLGPNLAYAARLKRKKTFVTIHEDEKLPTKIRYLARFSGVPYKRLTIPRSMWTEEEKIAVAQADKELSEYVVLRFMYGAESYVENVREAIKQQMQEWPFHLFFCDYGQCLKIRSYKYKDDKYSQQEDIYNELKQICLEFNIAGAGGAQTNRSGHRLNKSGTDFLRATDVGDSWGIVKKSSNVITMNRSDEDIELNRIVFLLDKVRNGKCPVAVVCSTQYDNCITHIPDTRYQTEIHVSEGPSQKKDEE